MENKFPKVSLTLLVPNEGKLIEPEGMLLLL